MTTAADFFARADAAEQQPLDYSALRGMLQQRQRRNDMAMMLALAANEAREPQLRQHFLGQSVPQNDIRLQGAVVDPSTGTVAPDPGFHRDQRVQALRSTATNLAGQEAANQRAAEATQQRATDAAEGRALRQTLAGIAAGNRPEPLVPVRDPATGNTILMPRSQAAGMRPPATQVELKADAAIDARKSDAEETLKLIQQAEALVPRATSSYVGAARDAAMRTTGSSTQAGDAAAQLKALSANLVLKMPKLSGPQSDRDAKLYAEAAGQIGDPTMPAATKLAALRTIKAIQNRAAGLPEGVPHPNDKPPTPEQAGWSATRLSNARN